MTTSQLVTAGCLAMLGVAHSALGETDILRPLFAAEWRTTMPRWAVVKILRFAWHLTSVAWFALAAIVLGADPLVAVGVMSLVSAASIFVMLRGHLAWPLFLLAGLAALYGSQAFGSSVLLVISVGTAGVVLAAAGLHVYWAVGGRWLIERASPTTPGNTKSQPGPFITLVVAVVLAAFAGLILMTAFDSGPPALRWLVAIGVAVLTVRAIGDNRVVGFSKKIRDTAFGRADEQYFTPLIVFLALGATAALLT
ncbi:MAG: DUF3995 domain-containing protein [Acidimicrobiales bacterium]